MKRVKTALGPNAAASSLTGPTISAKRGMNQSLAGSANTRCMSMTASRASARLRASPA
jgi:hypothetical protein